MSAFAIPYPAIDPVALQLGPLSIKWYGLAYVAGLLLGWLYIKRLLTDRSLWREGKPPFAPELADDLFIWVALGVVIGGRLGNVLLYEPLYYLHNPLEIVQIWRGGMAFHGGLVGTIVAMWLFARRVQAPELSVMDLVAAAVPIGLFFGRVANFINAEVLGTPSQVPWAIVFPGAGPEPRHPAQLYEAALEGVVLFLVLNRLVYGRGSLKTPGLTGAAFLVGYGIFRIFCEVFKMDEHRALLGSLPITSGMAYSIPMVVAGLIAIHFVRRKSAP
ncbi:MAG: prolipoprotein diacylglyceryl transferase [Hyphomicrobiaceae bacterium]|nr:prolipoprotein diacylglyceryl transferase [Hyphomicrobiaceae bacterium]